MVYVLLADGFEEIEALAPVDFLRRAGISVATVSVGDYEVLGVHNIRVKADCVLSQVDFSSAEMVILPGGMPGTKNLDACPRMTEILISVSQHGGILAAICAAPMVLGKRGFLEGKKAVCYPGFESTLQGAEIVQKNVVRDGAVVTGKSAGVAWEFGYTLARMLADREICEKVREGLFLPEFGDCV